MLLKEWVEKSGVAFGTSGARGLVSQLSDRTVFLYTTAFLRYLVSLGEFKEGDRVALGGDLRPSTPRIAASCAAAIRHCGGRVLNCGAISSPAIALYAIREQIASVMVTGSHIPDDRNGIKFTRRSGEITKRDEASILQIELEEHGRLFNDDGSWVVVPEVHFSFEEMEAHALYRQRAIDFFGKGILQGYRLGFYQHSGVARELIPDLLKELGAEVTLLGGSDEFIPVDTEAIREEDRQLAQKWAATKKFDAILSTDGDADRPLLADEKGEWWSGDQLGLLATRWLGIEAIALPVSSSTAAEKSGWVRTLRTKIGSPYVIEGMERLEEEGYRAVAGYEANGGYLLQSELLRNGKKLAPLPTRDVVLPLVAVLIAAKERGCSLSAFRKELPPRFTASGRLKEFSSEKSRFWVDRWIQALGELESALAPIVKGSTLQGYNAIDGLRCKFSNGSIIHFRASGNAPEFRCYVESGSVELSEQMLQEVLQWMETLRAQ